jgi:hypothetical protein
MKRLLMMLPLLLLAGEATALEKHMVNEMTCEQVKAALQSEGKALMRWHSKNVPGMMRYGMYHAGRHMCKNQQIAMRVRVSASDTKDCIVVQCSQYGRSAYPRY